jgi:hypothetical protein
MSRRCLILVGVVGLKPGSSPQWTNAASQHGCRPMRLATMSVHAYSINQIGMPWPHRLAPSQNQTAKGQTSCVEFS